MEDYFILPALRNVIKRLLSVTSNENNFNIVINVKGGGISGQAGAVCHWNSKGLLVGFLTEEQTGVAF